MTKAQATPTVVIANLARRLKYRRLELGLTPEQLADKTGLNPHQIQKLEMGELDVTIGTLVISTDDFGMISFRHTAPFKKMAGFRK